MSKVKNDTRHQARRVALTTIFCTLCNNGTREECEEFSVDTLEISEKEWDRKLGKALITGVLENKDEIDPIIKDCAPQWPLNKIFKVDLVILELAIFELLIKKNTPERVAIDEAVELAKSRLPSGISWFHCEECEEAIPEARRQAIPGVHLCVGCQSKLEKQQKNASCYNRRGSKDSQLR